MRRSTLLHTTAHLLALAALIVASVTAYRVATVPTAPVPIRAGLRFGLPACTLYVSPSGGGTQSGADAADPKAFSTANAGTSSGLGSTGGTVCLEAGTYALTVTFYPALGDSAAHLVTYEPYNGAAVQLNWNSTQWPTCPTSSGSPNCNLFSLGSGTQGTPAYTTIDCNGTMTLDGSNNGSDTIASEYAEDAFRISGADHVRIEGCAIQYFGAAGIATTDSDYQTYTGNNLWRNGYVWGGTQTPPGNTYDPSAISLNSVYNADSTTSSFHNIIANNSIGGQEDDEYAYSGSPCASTPCQITDGNGIIIDLMHGGEATGGPPTLVANNVVYENGGRGIDCNQVSNCYVVNNTTYQDLLESQTCTTSGQVCSALLDKKGEIYCQSCTDSFFIDNTAWAWGNTAGVDPGQATYIYVACASGCDAATDAGNHWSHNASYNGGANFCQGWGSSLCVPADQLASANIAALQPAYAAPSLASQSSAVPPSQMSSAPAPSTLSSDFQIASTDPLAGAGVDPATVSGVPSSLGTAMDAVVNTDLAGTGRPDPGWDIGAYQSTPAPTATPTVTNTPGGVHTRPHVRPFPRLGPPTPDATPTSTLVA